jgi:flagellar assembly protein FliH
MDISELPPDQVASLLARILHEKDPASVGLRRIIRRKTADADDFPLRLPPVEEFMIPGKGKKLLTDDERRIIELERQVKGLREALDQQPDNARRAVEKAYQKGLQEGIAQGEEQGREAAGAEFKKRTDTMQSMIGAHLKNIEQARHTLFADAERQLLDLCLRIVRKVIAAEPALRPEVILNVVRKALSFVAEKDKLVIRLAPGDLETVTGNKDFWAPVTERLKTISIEPDERIGRGGCIIESASGIIDARLDKQVDELSSVIEKAWESSTNANDTQAAVQG